MALEIGVSMRILLVEDNEDLGEAIEKRLRSAGHSVEWVRDGAHVAESAQGDEFDAMVDEAIELAGTDRQAAQDLYTQAQTLLVNEAPGLFFMDVGAWYAVPTYLGGFEYNLNYPFATFFYPLHLAQ